MELVPATTDVSRDAFAEESTPPRLLNVSDDPPMRSLTELACSVFGVSRAAVLMQDSSRAVSPRKDDIRFSPSLLKCLSNLHEPMVMLHGHPSCLDGAAQTYDGMDVQFLAASPIFSSAGLQHGLLCLIHDEPRTAFHMLEPLQKLAEHAAEVILQRIRAADDKAAVNLSASQTTADESASRDALTGLCTRISFLESLQKCIDGLLPNGRGLGVLFIDIDSFKRINDSLGHNKGDALLIEVARRIQSTVVGSSGCSVARLAADEFAVLLNDVAQEEDVLSYAASLDFLLKNSFDCIGQRAFLSASIGATFGQAGEYVDAEQLLDDADIAMNYAKANGKAQHALFSQQMRAEALARLELENDIRLAIQENQFELHYQPKVRMADGQLRGFEALIRWRHPERGMVSPVKFIPIAEEAGLITEIGRWAARTAIHQLSEWRRQGAVGPAVTMAVNISTRQFGDTLLLSTLKADLADAKLPAECLVLEVTESVLVADAPSTVALLDSIVAAGIGLDLDDFGTGYSSLSYLHRFPFRSVKIDRSFVGRMSTDPKSVKLVSSIVALARALDMRVIAEGVETQDQVEHLLKMGCTIAQGYLFSAPKAAKELAPFLEKAMRVV